MPRGSYNLLAMLRTLRLVSCVFVESKACMGNEIVSVWMSQESPKMETVEDYVLVLLSWTSF